MLSHRWCKTVSFFGNGENKKGDNPTKHNYDYGLIDQEAFQNELLKKCNGIEWLNETAKDIKEKNKLSEVICFSGLRIKARLVIDASGHKSNFIKDQSKMKSLNKLRMELSVNFHRHRLITVSYTHLRAHET